MELELNNETRNTNIKTGRAVEMAKPSSAGTPRTLIVSDVRLYREGLAMTFASRPDLALAGTADSLNCALALLESMTPTVVVLDTGMPQALEVARAMMLAAPRTKIVAIAVADDAADVVACAEAGMAGYVSRDGSTDDVVAAIHGVLRGEFSCPPRMVSTLFRRLASLAPPRLNGSGQELLLTKRETEIVSLIDEGLSNKEIGRSLRIGTPTVKNHVHHILEKLHVSRRGQAAAALRANRSVPSLSIKRRRGEVSRTDPMI